MNNKKMTKQQPQQLEKGRRILVTGVNTTVTLIGLFGIVLALVISLLVQSANATTDAITDKNVRDQEASKITRANTPATTDNSSSVVGNLFLSGEDTLTSFNPVNDTYTKISYAGDRIIIPTKGDTTGIINATETGNLTFKLQSNGISLVEGQSILTTKGGVANNNSSGSEQQENATIMLIDLNGVRDDDPRSSTGVAFFITNSTGQLSFLDEMIAVYQVTASPAGTDIKMWEWKGADLTVVNEANGGTGPIGN